MLNREGFLVADSVVMKNIMIVTSEPSAHYHLKYFKGATGRNLTHIVPSVDEVKEGFINVSAHVDSVADADLLVVAGGNVSDWCSHVAFTAERYDIPVVFSELAYIKPFTGEQFTGFSAASVASKYGEFKLRTYLNDDDLPVTVTGHPMFDSLPAWSPVKGRVLILSSLFKDDEVFSLRESATILQKDGFDVIVRLHPGESGERWGGFKISHEPDLLQDLMTAEVAVGVPGTVFTVAAGMGVPIIAVEGSTSDYTLEEFKHLFPYVKPTNVKDTVVNVTSGKKNMLVSDELKSFIIPPMDGNMPRLLAFWDAEAI